MPPPTRPPEDDWEAAPVGGFSAVEDDWIPVPPGGFQSTDVKPVEPGWLESLTGGLFGGADKAAAKPVEDDWEQVPPNGTFDPTAPGGSRFIRQGEAAPEKPAPGLWESFTGGLERGVSGAVQSGELLVNKMLGRSNEAGTEERPIAAEDIKPSEALTSPISKGVPWLAYQTGRAVPALAGAAAGGPAGAAGIMAGSGLGQFLSDFGPRYQEMVQQGKSEDQALTDSLKSAGVSGVATGASFGAFGLPGNFLKQLLIQPSIGGAETVLQNYLAGRPVTEGTGEALLGGGLGMVIPAAGHYLATRGRASSDISTRQGQTAGADIAPGTAQEPKPTSDVLTGDPQNKAVIGETGQREVGGEDLVTTGDRYAKPELTPRYTGTTEIPDVYRRPEYATPAYTGEPTSAKGPEDYGKRTPPRGAGGGMNVGEDPTVDSAFRRESTRAPVHELDPTVAHALEQVARSEPAASVRESPSAEPRTAPPETAPRAQAAEARPDDVLRGPKPARIPQTVGDQLRVREEANRLATQQAMESTRPPQRRDFRTTRSPDGTWALRNRAGDVLGDFPDLGAVHRAVAQMVRPPLQGAIRSGGRGRSGRPIETIRRGITEQEAVGRYPILERGFERATAPRLPSEQAPPLRQAVRRQTPFEKGAAKYSDQDLRDIGNRPSTAPDLRATIANELQRRQAVNVQQQPAAQRQVPPTAQRQPANELARLSNQELHARGMDPKTTTLQREAVIAELQRRQAAGVQQQPPAQQTIPPSAQRQAAPGGPGQRQPPPPPGGPPRQPPPAQRQPAQPRVDRTTVSDHQKGMFATIGRSFYPRGTTGFEGNVIRRKALGEWNRLKDVAAARLTNDLHVVANRMQLDPMATGPGSFRNFMRHMEGGNISQLPAGEQKLAQALRKGLDDVRNKLASMPKHAQMQFIQDYFPHMWESNQKLDSFLRGLGRSGSGSLKKRTHITYEDGIKAGLTPAGSNPIEMFSRYLDGIGTVVKQTQVMRDLEPWIHWNQPKTIAASGTPNAFTKNAPLPGYEPLNMPWAYRQRGPIQEQAWVPRDMAYTLNQAYSKGLREYAGPVVDAGMKIKNMHTAIELGGPMYHTTTVSMEALGSGFARAFRELGTGRLDRAATEFAKAIVAPKDAFPGSYGDHLVDVWQGKKQGTAQEMQIMEALEAANIHPVGLLHTGEFEMTQLRTYWDSYWRGAFPREFRETLDKIKAGGWGGSKEALALVPNQVARLMQTIAQPLFQYAIPRLKLSSMVKDMEQFLYHNPNTSKADLARMANRISNSIDSRFGEAVRDNLGMNKAMSDAGYLGLRSFAWTVLGPFREIAGGYQSLGKGLAKGEWRLSPKSAAYDPRIGYALAFPFTIGLVGSLINYARSGQFPQDWRDFFLPKTGGEVKSGGQDVPERMRIPGYHKDFIGYYFHPPGHEGSLLGGELKAKFAGVWSALAEQVMNRDWRDMPIVPPNPTIQEWLGYRGGHLASKLKPIGIQQLMEPGKKGSHLTLPEKFMGFGAAGAYIQNPKSTEKFATDKEQKLWEQKEKADNTIRRNQGLPQLPPRRLPKKEYARGGSVRTGYNAAR
jgi:hypothetical protein